MIISIHALLAESDIGLQNRKKRHNNFYPRSPCGERLMNTLIFAGSMLFLSTLSLRRATLKAMRGDRKALISIHALLAESDAAGNKAGAESFKFLSTLSLRRATQKWRVLRYRQRISIHALLAESDGPPSRRFPWVGDFYPRSPCGERRVPHHGDSRGLVISIHALLAESDPPQIKMIGAPVDNFYPRSPCGERPTATK